MLTIYFQVSIYLIWEMDASYNSLEKAATLQVFEDFVESDGVELDKAILMQRVLVRFREVNIDFVDVYLAKKSRSLELPI